MSLPTFFRYAFREKTTNLYYTMIGDTVVTSSAPKYFLDDSGKQYVSPIDWKETMLGYTRNEKYNGIMTKFSVPLSFTFEATRILNKVFADTNFDGTLTLSIEHVPDDRIGVYEIMYEGDVDMSVAERYKGTDGNYFKTNIRERGLPQLLKNLESIPYEITLDSDAITIAMDGIKQLVKYEFATSYSLSNYPEGAYFIPWSEIGHDGNVEVINSDTVQFGNLTSDPYKDNNLLYFNYDVNGGNIHVDWIGTIANLGSSLTSIRFILQVQVWRGGNYTTPVNAGTTTIYTDSALAAGASRQLNFTADYGFDFLAGDRVTITADITGLSSGTVLYNIGVNAATKMTVTGDYRLKTSDYKAFTYPVFIEKLLKKALGEDIYLQSDFLNGNLDRVANYDNLPKLTTVTSGRAIRGTADFIKTTIEDAFQDMQRWGLGLGIEGNAIRIEKRSYFFQRNKEVYTFEDVKSFRHVPAVDMLGNAIKVGYKTDSSQSVNSIFDYMSTNFLLLPVTSTKKELDWSSPYYASPYIIESIRGLRLNVKDSSDDDSDERVFLVSIDPTPVGGKFVPYRPAGTITGVPFADSLYNFDLTPMRTLFHNSDMVQSILVGKDPANDYITYQTNTGTRNDDLYTDFSSRPIKENESYALENFMVGGDLVTGIDTLLSPGVIEIETNVPDNLFELMESDFTNRYGAWGFRWNDEIFYMYIDDIALKKGSNDLYRVRGRGVADNDLEKMLA